MCTHKKEKPSSLLLIFSILIFLFILHMNSVIIFAILEYKWERVYINKGK